MSNRNKFSSKRDIPPQAEIFAPSVRTLHILAGIAIIVLAAFLVYYPSLSGGFIWDDDRLLTENRLIKSSDGLYRIWCSTESLEYYPVTNTLFWIEWRFWEMSPTGYHVTNLILHIISSLLIWIVLRKLSIPGAFLAVLIFAVHPVNVESVAWIAQRKTILAMLFFLLSILCYLKFETTSSATQERVHQKNSSLSTSPWPLAPYLWYWLSLAVFILAMLSKGSVAVLPFLLLTIIWWQHRGTVPIFASAKMGLSPFVRWDLLRTAPFFLVAVLLTPVNIWFQTHGSGEEFRTIGLAERLLGAGGVVWFYLYKAILPIDLSYVYTQWRIEIDNLLWWLPLLGVLAVTAVLWWYKNKWSRPFLFAWAVFCISLAPVMGFTDVEYMQCSLVADHYQYIAVIAVIALATAGWGVWRRRMPGPARWRTNGVAIVSVGLLMLLTWQQSRLYRNPVTLYQATLEKNPDSFFVHNSLGIALSNADRLWEAIDHFNKALRLKSDYLEARFNLAVLLNKVSRPREAIDNYEQVLLLKPDYPETDYNLAIILDEVGRTPESIVHFQKALRLKPDNAEAHNHLGVVLGKVGRLQEAIAHFQQALLLTPDLPHVENNLGNALDDVGRQREAIKHYQQALRLKPDYIKAYSNLALVYAKTNQPALAIATAQKAVDVARSTGQAVLAKQIEEWLNAYRAGQSAAPGTPPSTNP